MYKKLPKKKIHYKSCPFLIPLYVLFLCIDRKNEKKEKNDICIVLEGVFNIEWRPP